MGKCQLCKKDVFMPFQCSYCGQYFCDQHRLPEKHLCPNLPKRGWKERKSNKERPEIKRYKTPLIPSNPPEFPWSDQNRQKEKPIPPKKKNKTSTALILIIIISGFVGIMYYNDPDGFVSYVSNLNEDMNEAFNETTIQEITNLFNETTEKIDTIVKEIEEEYSEIVDPENVYGNYSLGLVKSPDGVLSNSYGDFIVLINNKNAVNPSYNQLVKFLEVDKTDMYPYQYIDSETGSYYPPAESHVNITFIKRIIDGGEDMIIPRQCGDFAQRLHNIAEMAGIICGYVSVDLVGYTDPYDFGIPSDAGHAFNVFNTTDKGIIFIDCTGGVGEGPSNRDRVISNFRVGEVYTTTSLFPETGWSDVWDTMGEVTDIYITWDGDWE